MTPLLARLLPTLDLEPDGVVCSFVSGLTLVIGVVARVSAGTIRHGGDLVSAIKGDHARAPSRIHPRRVRSTLWT